MKDNALIMMLHNTSLQRFHPIMYWESPLPGGEEANQKLIRYKSKGHHTSGFENREDAIKSINDELVSKLKGMGFDVHMEIEGNIEWNGEGIPADVQMRVRN